MGVGGELRPRVDAELAPHVGDMPLDRCRADAQPFADRAPALLCGERAWDRALAGRSARASRQHGPRRWAVARQPRRRTAAPQRSPPSAAATGRGPPPAGRALRRRLHTDDRPGRRPPGRSGPDRSSRACPTPAPVRPRPTPCRAGASGSCVPTCPPPWPGAGRSLARPVDLARPPGRVLLQPCLAGVLGTGGRTDRRRNGDHHPVRDKKEAPPAPDLPVLIVQDSAISRSKVRRWRPPRAQRSGHVARLGRETRGVAGGDIGCGRGDELTTSDPRREPNREVPLAGAARLYPRLAKERPALAAIVRRVGEKLEQVHLPGSGLEAPLDRGRAAGAIHGGEHRVVLELIRHINVAVFRVVVGHAVFSQIDAEIPIFVDTVAQQAIAHAEQQYGLGVGLDRDAVARVVGDLFAAPSVLPPMVLRPEPSAIRTPIWFATGVWPSAPTPRKLPSTVFFHALASKTAAPCSPPMTLRAEAVRPPIVVPCESAISTPSPPGNTPPIGAFPDLATPM